MAQYNVSNNAPLNINKSIYDVIMVANSTGGIINTFAGGGGGGNTTIGNVSILSLPVGSNVIGGVTQSGAWSVSVGAGSVHIGNVSITAHPGLATSSNVIGAVTQSGAWSIGISSGTNQVGNVSITAHPGLATSSNVIGAVTQSGAWSLSTGSSQIGNVSITALPGLGTGSNVIGAVTQSGAWNIGQATTIKDGTIAGNLTSFVVATSGNTYNINDTITLNDGGSTHAVLTVTSTRVSQNPTINAGGTFTGTAGYVTLTATTGTGTKAVINATANSTTITTINSIINVGAYTVNPTNVNAEPVTATNLTGCTLVLEMGVLNGNITTGGVVNAIPSNDVAQLSTSGSGTGFTATATWSPIVTTISGAPTNGWKINNPSLTSDIWASDTAVSPSTNGPSSICIPGGGGNQYSTEPGEKPSGNTIKIIGTIVGSPYICRVW